MTTGAVAQKGPKPVLDGLKTRWHMSVIYFFTIAPTLLLVWGVIKVWGWGISWVDIALFWFFYFIRCGGVTIGYHRYFTHGAFKARQPLRVALAIAGDMAAQGPVIDWTADHRRHHAFSDRDGDPHSPWLFGTSPWAVVKGFWHAHMGWLFSRDKTNAERFVPDLLKDKAIRKVDELFWLWTILTFVLPAIMGGLITWSWWGALTAFFWAGVVGVAFLHHVTWSVNSICHMANIPGLGSRPFASRDRSVNFWPLAILSMGESWHNLHHADPTSARHGVKRGQIDISARIIWVFEKLGWVYDVRWPTPARMAKLTK